VGLVIGALTAGEAMERGSLEGEREGKKGPRLFFHPEKGETQKERPALRRTPLRRSREKRGGRKGPSSRLLRGEKKRTFP